MKRLFRFFAWVLSRALWFSVAFIASTLGVYFAYGVAGAELSYNTTVAIILASSISIPIAAEFIVHVICDSAVTANFKCAESSSDDDGGEQ
jgi:hypothetical protein